METINEVWCYSLKRGIQRISMPKEAKILDVVEMGGNATLLVQTLPPAAYEEKEVRKFVVVRQGEGFEANTLRYIGNAVLDGGETVYCVFEQDRIFLHDPYVMGE